MFIYIMFERNKENVYVFNIFLESWTGFTTVQHHWLLLFYASAFELILHNKNWLYYQEI